MTTAEALLNLSTYPKKMRRGSELNFTRAIMRYFLAEIKRELTKNQIAVKRISKEILFLGVCRIWFRQG